MEEIKCPSCGSGAVRKITEEKYEWHVIIFSWYIIYQKSF